MVARAAVMVVGVLIRGEPAERGEDPALAGSRASVSALL